MTVVISKWEQYIVGWMLKGERRKIINKSMSFKLNNTLKMKSALSVYFIYNFLDVSSMSIIKYVIIFIFNQYYVMCWWLLFAFITSIYCRFFIFNNMSFVPWFNIVIHQHIYLHIFVEMSDVKGGKKEMGLKRFIAITIDNKKKYISTKVYIFIAICMLCFHI